VENLTQLFSENPILVWLLVAAVVIAAIFLFGRSRSRGPSIDRPADRLSSPEAPTFRTGPHETQIDLVSTRPPGPVEDQRIPKDDVPPDLEALPGGSQKRDPSVQPHTVNEIQRHEPKLLSLALENTRSGFFGRLKNLFGSKPTLSSDEMEGLEEILYTSDLGPQTVQRLLEAVELRMKSNAGGGFEGVRTALKDEMMEIFDGLPNGAAHAAHGSEDYIEGLEKLAIWDKKPAVLMIVGVNGAGKTTTIGKLSRKIAQSGRKVLVAAGDTFRAAAGDQLKVWTERARVEIFSPEGVTDPSAVAYSAFQKGQADGFDVVIIDTAGRLHTQKNLMEELKKMKRVIGKLNPEAPHETLLVLDANSGQNALMQAREFHQALEVTGVVLTKLDGTAKGGVAVGLACELQIPIKLIGVGEGLDDLRKFSSREFVDSIL
jgi:fused signal recognition particle receptor